MIEMKGITILNLTILWFKNMYFKLEDGFDNKKQISMEPADYETAISATEFGFFNYSLMLMTVPVGLTIVFVTTSLSLAIPAAQCDLNLTIYDKGLLNSSVYIGMMKFWKFIINFYN